MRPVAFYSKGEHMSGFESFGDHSEITSEAESDHTYDPYAAFSSAPDTKNPLYANNPYAIYEAHPGQDLYREIDAILDDGAMTMTFDGQTN